MYLAGCHYQDLLGPLHAPAVMQSTASFVKKHTCCSPPQVLTAHYQDPLGLFLESAVFMNDGNGWHLTKKCYTR